MNESNRYDNINTEIQIQTRIHVQPHVLNDENERALVTCERACQTAVSSFPDIEDSVFYSLLEFIPYKDIDNNAVRILDLPRKHRLQFKLPEVSEDSEDTSSSTSTLSYTDTQKKASPKKALKQLKFSTGSSSSEDVLITTTTTATTENNTQTSLTVVPHVLEENEVAKILENAFAQVEAKISIESDTTTETVGEVTSATETDILSEIAAKIRALNESDETECKHYIICTNHESGSCTCSCNRDTEKFDTENPCTLCSCNSWDLSSIKYALPCRVACEEKHTQTCLQEFLIYTSIQVQTNYSESSEKSISLEESKDEPAEGSGISHSKAVSSAEREVIRLAMINSLH